MTEVDWAESTNPLDMLRAVRERKWRCGPDRLFLHLPTIRQIALITYGCLRQVWPFISDKARSATLKCEAAVERPVYDPLPTRNVYDDAFAEIPYAISLGMAGRTGADVVRDVLGYRNGQPRWSLCNLCGGHGWKTHYDHDNPSSIRLPCKKCGPPPEAVVLAKNIYENRTFNEMYPLADMLEETGYGWRPLLEHLRGKVPCIVTLRGRNPCGEKCWAGCECKGTGYAPGPAIHVRGSWGLDLILGQR